MQNGRNLNRQRIRKDVKEETMPADQKILLTVILHHDQSKNLNDILAHTKETGFYRDFPPEGSELVSWVVAMSFGYIIQLRVEPDAIRKVNIFFEKKAWGAFRYEVYPSYNFAAVAEKLKQEHS
jgi:hypothetical protein